ncbi:MAG: histidinol-phosphatase HisJ family protein [Emergencia sp.]|nr:histidinol-phosphatase HisJ family protein [Emergencia sp.]
MIILNPKGDSNFHTHTCYCDGKDRPEELVEKAMELGFSALGFSGHEYAPQDTDFCMSRADTQKYWQEVLALKERYKNRINIFLGIERDYFGQPTEYAYDYIIGSLHYVEKDGVLLSVDNTEEIMVSNVEQHFGGNYRKYVERYYEHMADVLSVTGGSIVGHFDLITKFNEGGHYFDESAAWYKKAALRALAKLAESRPIFEINTGAMARGYRSRPYPDRFILEEINRLGCPVILSSDCHDKDFLNLGFRDIVENLRDID